MTESLDGGDKKVGPIVRPSFNLQDNRCSGESQKLKGNVCLFVCFLKHRGQIV